MIYLLTDNILVASKILAGLRTCNAEARAFTRDGQLYDAMETAQPHAVLVSLNARAFDPVEVVRRVKESSEAVTVVFGGHADADARALGEAARADAIVTNSAVILNTCRTLRDAGVPLPDAPGACPPGGADA